MKRLHRYLILSVAAVAAVVSLSGCGPLIASATVGPDLYVGDYTTPAYPIYNPGYYPGWTPGLIGPGYIPSTPPPPPGGPAPVRPTPGNPGQPNRPNAGPTNRPTVAPGTAGSPSQGGFRGQNGSNSRH